MAMSKQQQGDPVGFLDLVGPDLSACVFARLADPADLARATTVSRPWRRFVEGNGFLKKVLGLPRRCSGVWRPPSCRRRSSPPPQGPRSSHHGHSRASRSSSSLSWPMIDERRQIRRQGQGGGMREGQRKVPALARRLSVPPPPGRPAARGFSRAVRPEDDPFLAAYLACTKSSGDGGKEKTGGAAREPKGQRRFTWGLGVLSCKRANGVVEQSMGRYRWSSKAALNTTDLVGGWADKALCLLLLPMSSLEERMMVKQQRMMVPGHGERGSAKIDRWLPPVVWIWGIFQAGNNLL